MNLITYIVLTFLVTKIYCFSGIYYNIIDEPVLLTETYPFSFVYDQNIDFLLMEITLKLEPSVNEVNVKIYQSVPGTQAEEVKIIINTKKGEAKSLILKSLVYKDIFIDVELQNQTALCSTTRVAEGWAKSTLFKKYDNYYPGFTYYYTDKNKIIYDTGNCLAPSPCGIVVDRRGLCKGQAIPYVNCTTEASQFICTMSNFPKGRHKWFQTYDDKRVIGDIPSTFCDKNRKIKLFIKKELFDNNSTVVIESEDGKNVIKAKIKVTEKDNYMEVYNTTLKYSEATDIQFSCNDYLNYVSLYSHMHVGIINSKTNTIKTFNGTTLQINQFNMADNGTILCCLYYKTLHTTDFVEPVMNIKRYVEKKTLLIYQPKSIAKLAATIASDNSNIPKTSTARDITHDSDARGPLPTASTTRINILTENASNEHETDEHYNATNITSYVLIIVLPILAIVIFVAIILFAIKKCSRKKRNRPQIPRPLPQIPRPQLQNEPDLHTPFYVNMLFRRECEKEIQAQEEPKYEEVTYH